MLKERFERKDIVTQSFSVNPNYEWNNGDNKQKGYIAQHYLKVEMSSDETDKIGEAIDAIVDNAASLSYVNFELSQENQNKYKTEAMKLAAQDATAKAEGVAEGLGKSLGSLVSVTINDYGYVPWLAYDASGVPAAEAREAATSIVPSEQEISASVTAVFKIR